MRRLLRSTARLAAVTGLLRPFLGFASARVLNRTPAGRLAFPFIARRGQPSYSVLLYHRVSDDPDPFFSPVPTGIFARQMAALATCCTVFPLEELVERSARRDLPPRAVAITFDDGYRDNYENAFPVLRRLGLPATIFLATSGLTSDGLLWHDRVFAAFRATTAESVTFNGRHYPLVALPQKRAALASCLQRLRECDPRSRDELIDRLTSLLQVAPASPLDAPKLIWPQVREMARHRITFGAHTVTHPILTRMPLGDAAGEILAAKATIEAELGAPVQLFAYPNGQRAEFNDSIKGVLAEAGFLCAATTIWGPNTAETDPFELRRISLWDADPDTAILRLGWYALSGDRTS